MAQLTQPRITKHKKHFKLRKFEGITKDSGLINLGDFGVKITEPGVITGKQIATLNLNLLRKLRQLDKDTKVIWNLFAHIPYSKKPAEVRMGGGKGGNEGYCARVLPGKVILEVICKAKNAEIIWAMNGTINKLPMKSKVIERWI